MEKSVRCSAISKSTGERCSLLTHKTYPCCWMHTKSASRYRSKCAGDKLQNKPPDSSVFLRVKQSGIEGAGMGLWVVVPKRYKRKDNTTGNVLKNSQGERIVFKKGEVVAVYTGEKLSPKQVEERYPGETLAKYAITTSNGVTIDAATWKSGVARYANDCCKSAGKCTCANLEFKQKASKVYMVALRDIAVAHDNRKGIELFVKYGNEYWQPSNKVASAAQATLVTQKNVTASEVEVLRAVKGKSNLQQLVDVKKLKNGRFEIKTKNAGSTLDKVSHTVVVDKKDALRKQMTRALKTLKKLGWRHLDLQKRNVAFDGKKFTLIDFGKMERRDKFNVLDDVNRLMKKLLKK